MTPKPKTLKERCEDAEKAIDTLKHNARTLDDMYLEDACRLLERTLTELMEEVGRHKDTDKLKRRTIQICNDCYELKGEMCHTAECIFCRCTMKEVGEYLDILLIRPVIDGKREKL